MSIQNEGEGAETHIVVRERPYCVRVITYNGRVYTTLYT